jgi:hypothetical protein
MEGLTSEGSVDSDRYFGVADQDGKSGDLVMATISIVNRPTRDFFGSLHDQAYRILARECNTCYPRQRMNDSLLVHVKGEVPFERFFRAIDRRSRGIVTMVHVHEKFLNFLSCEMLRLAREKKDWLSVDSLILPVDWTALCTGDVVVLLEKCCSLMTDDALEVFSAF